MSDAETIRMLVFYRKANCMRTTGKKLKFTASRMGEFIGWKPWQRVLMELLAEKYEEYASISIDYPYDYGLRRRPAMPVKLFRQLRKHVLYE